MKKEKKKKKGMRSHVGEQQGITLPEKDHTKEEAAIKE